MLRPPNAYTLELICAMGGPGSGKTYAWASWAHWMRKTGADGKVFVFNTDRPLARLFETWDGLDEIVTVWPDAWSTVENYEHLMEGMKKCKEVVAPKRNDLVVVDLMGSVWDMTQDWYSQRVYGSSLGELATARHAEYVEYLEEAKANRERKIKGEAPTIGGDHGKEWGDIKRLYREFTNNGLLRLGCHVFVATGQEPVGSRDEHLSDEFKRLGLKPRGEKTLAHFFDTTLHMQAFGDKWVVSTVRETSGPTRQRKKLQGSVIGEVEKGGFVGTYLVGVGGWRL